MENSICMFICWMEHQLTWTCGQMRELEKIYCMTFTGHGHKLVCYNSLPTCSTNLQLNLVFSVVLERTHFLTVLVVLRLCSFLYFWLSVNWVRGKWMDITRETDISVDLINWPWRSQSQGHSSKLLWSRAK